MNEEQEIAFIQQISKFEHDYSEIIKQSKEPTNEDQTHLVKVLCTINQSSNVIKGVKPPIRSLSRSLEIIMKEYRDTKNT